jgi:hypothetical protein
VKHERRALPGVTCALDRDQRQPIIIRHGIGREIGLRESLIPFRCASPRTATLWKFVSDAKVFT